MRALVLSVALLPWLAVAAEPAAPEAASDAVEALELEAREGALRLLQEDLEQRLSELAKLREELSAALTPGEQQSDRELKTLISFYQAMKPKNAAVLLEKLPEQLAADVLSSMKTREAGKILNVMKPDRAVRISRLMAGQRR